MVKKHHAWKVSEPDVWLYGEDVYFAAAELQDNVCKSVRPGHVQNDEHWTWKWRPCRIAKRAG